MMFPYTRLNEIFEYISNHHYISPRNLSTLLNVTERTIRSDIQALNDILNSHGAIIKLKRKNGYYIEISDQALYDQFLNCSASLKKNSIILDSSQDRIKYVLNTLLYQQDYISLDKLAECVYISRNTLQNYIKTIKDILKKYNLEYISKYQYGVKIIGNEEDKRKCLIDNILTRDNQNYIIGFSKDELTLFDGIDLNLLKNIVVKHLKSIDSSINDFNLKNLILHFALMISRIQHDCYIHFINTITIPNNMISFIENICSQLEQNFNIIITEGEKKYMYLHIIANTHFDSLEIDDENLKNDIQNLLDVIYQDYRFDLRNDDILVKDLFNHFKSIFTTKSYSINKKNPLLNTIKNNFPLSFEITFNATSKIFNQKPNILTEDEIGYVSLHIGAAIERCFSGTLQRKNVMLVCGSGQATTRMLEARLNVFFNDKIYIVNKTSYNEFISYNENDLKNIDFVISTIPLKSNIIPTITVNFSLNSEDVEAISKFISIISSNTSKKSDKFFDKNLFMYIDEKISKNDLLLKMYHALKKEKLVEEDFYDKVILRESLANTSMNEVFAIPHPIESWSHQTKVTVAILEKPIPWNSKDSVQIVFLLAIKKGDQLDIEHLYDLFIDIVNNPKLQQDIIHSSTFEQFLKSLHSNYQ